MGECRGVWRWRGLAAGAAIGAGVMMAKKLPDGPGKGDDHGKTE